MGAPSDVVASARARMNHSRLDAGNEIWEENCESVAVFFAVATQWNISQNGMPLGIIYTSLESVMNMAGIKKKRRAQLFGDVRIMEMAALEKFREKM